jgi:hypothetical protein
MQELLQAALAQESTLPWQSVALALLIAFVLSSSIAQVYIWTHRGLSYSRAYLQTLVLGSLVCAMLMLAIGNNMARGLGLLGTLALIRFRSTLKDPRDMVFVFAALSVGTASGMRSTIAAALGTAAFLIAAIVMHLADFGVRNRFDGLLRLQLPSDQETQTALQDVLERSCRRWVLVNLREIDQGSRAEHAYHVQLRNPERRLELVRQLSALDGARGVNFFLQDADEV